MAMAGLFSSQPENQGKSSLERIGSLPLSFAHLIVPGLARRIPAPVLPPLRNWALRKGLMLSRTPSLMSGSQPIACW